MRRPKAPPDTSDIFRSNPVRSVTASVARSPHSRRSGARYPLATMATLDAVAFRATLLLLPRPTDAIRSTSGITDRHD